MVSAVSLFPLVAAVLSAVLAGVGIAVPARHTRTTTFFVLLNAAAVLWCGSYFLRLNYMRGVDPALAQPGTFGYAILILTVLGVAGSPTYWFLFGAEQAGWRRVTTGWGLFAAHLPLLYTLAVALTNSQHHLFVAGMSGAATVYGPLVRPHHLTSTLMGVTGLWLCLKSLWERPGGGRLDALALGLSALPPTAASVLWMSRDATHVVSQALAVPVLQPVGNIVLAALVFRRGLADIVPVQTLRAIMENTDALLAYFDPRLRFISANSAFLSRIGVTEDDLLAVDFAEIIRDPSLSSMVRRAADLREPVEHRGWADALGEDAASSSATYWNWSLRPVGRGKRLEGFVFSLLEVTDEVRDAELNAKLSRLTSRLHATFDAQTSLPSILAAAADALEAEASLVLWEDGRWRWVRRCATMRAEWETFDPARAPDIGLALKTRQPVFVRDSFDDPRFDISDAVCIGSRGSAVLPLMVRDALLGAVAFRTPRPGALSGPPLTFTRELSRAVAVAVENARLYNSERRIAETLQDAMVSLPDRIEGLETAHAYRSATESARVGGDFYDLFRVNRDSVALVIGDVSGKGIQVAALTSLVRNTIRSEALRSASPATILTRTNEVIRHQLEIGTFVTALIVLLETDTGLLRYASAGHPAPFLITRRGEVERLEGSAVVLGAFEGVQYASQHGALERGDVLMLFTDGLIETREPGSVAEDRLGELLETLGGSGPAMVVDEVVRHAEQACGGSLKDDVAVLAVRLL